MINFQRIQRIQHTAIAFFVAWLACYSTATVFQSNQVLLALTDVGASISMSQWLAFIIQDWLGLMLSYGLIIAIGLGIGLGTANMIPKFSNTLSAHRLPLLVLAGGVSIWVILLAMQPILGVTLIAGARGNTGLLLQVCAGCLGGMVYARLSRKHAKPQR